MSESEAGSTEYDFQALRALQADASELERIEGLLDRFNVFETIGFVGQELVHSRFLSFLLDPRQKHGLGDAFFKGVLREALVSSDEATLVDLRENLDAMDLSDTLVRREHRFIDLLLENEHHELAVIVENKVWTTDHSNQLERYHRIVEANHPVWRVLGIYLTPFGLPPSREQDREKYLALGYGTVCTVLDGIVENRGVALSPGVRVAIEHYAGMVRRHIVGDPEVARLCREMYQKHKRALDLIIEHRPDLRSDTLLFLEQLIMDTEGLVLKNRGGGKLYRVFRPSGWEAPAALNTGSDPGGFLRFVFINRPNDLTLILQMTPGDNGIRRRLYQMGRNDESLFNNLVDPETTDWPTLYFRAFLNPKFCETASDSEREQEIRRQWLSFLEDDLPRIEQALRGEAWVWEPLQSNGT